MSTHDTRESAAAAAAKALGWTLYHHEPREDAWAFNWPGSGMFVVLPAPDAPLHEHGSFIFRLAEAINADGVRSDWTRDYSEVGFLRNATGLWTTRGASDLSWAALNAVSAARAGR